MGTKSNKAKRSVYQVVTDKIIEGLEQGKVAWRQPWVYSFGEPCTGCFSHDSGKPYSFLNQMLIHVCGGEDGEYLTMTQVRKEGGTVKAGAKAYMVTFSKGYITEEKITDEETGEELVNLKKHFALAYYNVFHINDCEGIKPKFATKKVKVSKLNPIKAAEKVVAGYVKREQPSFKLMCESASNEAYYSPVRDLVVVPQLSQYKDVAEYYSTLFHELTHSTMKESRCNRKEDNTLAAFGNAEYSKEELVAEIGSAMCINRLHIDADKAFKNSVAYIQGWLGRLKNDPKMIVIASAQAEKACKYIFGAKA